MKRLFIIYFIIFHYSRFAIADKGYSLKIVKPNTKKLRFGDCLGVVYTSLYISDKYKLPILFSSFVESKNLCIEDEVEYTQQFFNKFNLRNFETIKVIDEKQININSWNDVIYEFKTDFFFKYYEITNNKKLVEKFKKLIQPKKELQMPCQLTNEQINVAVHVRKGGGFDLPLLSKDGLDNSISNKSFEPIESETLAQHYKKKDLFFYADLRWPHKFPPDSYYVEQIKTIAKMFPGKEIHVHIFTDDPAPANLAEKYKKAICDPNIFFSFRAVNNFHNKNIAEDFFAMMKFDCLIRPVSTFSQFVEIVSNFKIVISPEHSMWVENNLLKVDKVKVVKNIF